MKKEEEKEDTKKDKAINIIAIAALLAIATGILFAIWVNNIGVRIAATGLVIFIADWVLYMWTKGQ